MTQRCLSYYLSFLFTHLVKGPWITGGWNRKYLENHLWTSLLVRAAVSYHFARLNWNKAVLLQISIIFDTDIFNSNFAFCVVEFLEPMMTSFSSMIWLAGWCLSRQIVKHISVFYLVCLKKVDKHVQRDLFCESFAITHHGLLKVNQTFC